MKVVLLGVDDWEVLYIDGKKREENHSLNLTYTLETIYNAFREGDQSFEFEHYYYEPDTNESREDLEMGVFYPDDLKAVEPHLIGDISL